MDLEGAMPVPLAHLQCIKNRQEYHVRGVPVRHEWWQCGCWTGAVGMVHLGYYMDRYTMALYYPSMALYYPS